MLSTRKNLDCVKLYIVAILIPPKSGVNSYKISVKNWVDKTNAIGIVAKIGRYVGTYAHKDIAFNFGMLISPVFQLFELFE